MFRFGPHTSIREEPKKTARRLEVAPVFGYDGSAAKAALPGEMDFVGYFSVELQEQVNTLMLPILALVGLAFAVLVDSYVEKRIKRIMLSIAAIVLSLIVEGTLVSEQAIVPLSVMPE